MTDPQQEKQEQVAEAVENEKPLVPPLAQTSDAQNAHFRFNMARSEGLRHIKENIPCQDAVATLVKTKNGALTHAIALSDGCSSSSLSHYGSQITVNTVVTLLCEQFDRLKMMPDRGLIPYVIDSIIRAQKQFIAEHRDLFEAEKEKEGKYEAFVERYGSRLPKESPDDIETLYFLRMMNATCLFVAERLGQTIYGHLGDGYIMRLTAENKMTIASMEDKTEEHNVTVYPQSVHFRYCMTGNTLAYRQMKIGRTKEPSYAWILISDGPENTLIEKKGPELRVRPYVFNLMVRCTMLEENYEASHKVLQEFFDGKLRDSTAIHGGDDISTAVMVHEDCMDICRDPAAHPVEYVTTVLETPAEEPSPIPVAPKAREHHTKEELETAKEQILSLFRDEERLTPSDIMEVLEDRENPFNPLEIDNILSSLIAEGLIRRLEMAVDESSGTHSYEYIGPSEPEEDSEDE